MSVGTTMKSMGKTAAGKVGSTAHDMKDRAMERRLDRAQSETERLRQENDLLRDEVSESRSEHRRILDLIEDRFAALSEDVEETTEGAKEKKSHKGRWFLFLLAIGGGVYYWLRQRTGSEDEAWTSEMPSVTQSGTTTTL